MWLLFQHLRLLYCIWACMKISLFIWQLPQLPFDFRPDLVLIWLRAGPHRIKARALPLVLLIWLRNRPVPLTFIWLAQHRRRHLKRIDKETRCYLGRRSGSSNLCLCRTRRAPRSNHPVLLKNQLSLCMTGYHNQMGLLIYGWNVNAHSDVPLHKSNSFRSWKNTSMPDKITL